MSSPDTDPLDGFIRRSMKEWIDRQPLPPVAQGKARLLSSASLQSLEHRHNSKAIISILSAIFWTLKALFYALSEEPAIHTKSTEEAIQETSGLQLVTARHELLHTYPSFIGILS